MQKFNTDRVYFLIQGGPYTYICHPHYLSILAFFTGISIVFRSSLAIIISSSRKGLNTHGTNNTVPASQTVMPVIESTPTLEALTQPVSLFDYEVSRLFDVKINSLNRTGWRHGHRFELHKS